MNCERCSNPQLEAHPDHPDVIRCTFCGHAQTGRDTDY